MMRRALHGSGETSLGKAVYEGRDDSKLIYKHRNGERNRLSVSFASELLDLSSLPFELDSPADYVSESREVRGEKYVIIDEEFKDYLFHPYKNEEIADLTGKSPATCKEYRFESGKAIPSEVYKTLFHNTSEILNSPIEITGPLEKPQLDRGENTLMRTADTNDVRLFSELGSLKSDSSHEQELLELIEDVNEIIQDDLRGTHIKSRSKIKGRYLNFMDDLGLVDKEGARAYRIEADKEYFELILQELKS